MSKKEIGFVYIWYDRKHKRFYVGSHWGTETDGYICSSSWMKESYTNRPEDFKRRVICFVYDRKYLLEEEHKWLSLIKDDELGKKYYNKRNHKFGHWANSGNNENFLKAMALKRGKPLSEKTKQNISKALKGKPKPHNIKNGSDNHFYGKKHSKESKQKQSLAKIGKPSNMKGKKHTEEAKEKNRLAHLGKIPWNKGIFPKCFSNINNINNEPKVT